MARQNPLSKFEEFMRNLVEGKLFASIFPSRLLPMEVGNRLQLAMEEYKVKGKDRYLVPSIYDIYISPTDHQQMSASLSTYIRQWQDQLVEFARQRHYTLRTMPTLRVHPKTGLGIGKISIEVKFDDLSNDGGTQVLSPEQLEQIRKNSPPVQPLPVTPPSTIPSAPSWDSLPNASSDQPIPGIPQAWLNITLPDARQQTYNIQKSLINIGRQLSNDIIVEDRRVSRHHAQIKYEPDHRQFILYDLGSTNGITVNIRYQKRQHILQNNDHFTIGSYDFRFERR